MTARELWKWFKNMDSPEDIFAIHEEGVKLSAAEQEELVKLGVGDAISMRYITAVEMKKKGTWAAYLEEWEKNKHRTGRERLEDYMRERGLSYGK